MFKFKQGMQGTCDEGSESDKDDVYSNMSEEEKEKAWDGKWAIAPE